MHKKRTIIAILLLLVFALPVVAHAGLMDIMPIQEPIKETGGATLKEEVKVVGNAIVSVVRTVFVVIAVVFLIYGALALLAGGGDPEKVAQGKRMFVGFLLSAICIYSTESIVGTLLGWFNL